MKIIAKGTPGMLLVEMTNSELCKMVGFSDTYDMAAKNGREWDSPDKEFDIDERFSNINALHNLPVDIENIKKSFSASLKALERAEKAVSETSFTPLKQKHK